jgi:glutaconate CoA-transferase, subunit A
LLSGAGKAPDAAGNPAAEGLPAGEELPWALRYNPAMTAFISVAELAARIPDGSLLALPPDHVGVAMAATRALIRRGARNLRLLTVPTGGYQVDLLVGAGIVGEIETAGVALGEAESAGRFIAVAKAGSVVIRDSTCPAIHAGLQASEKGVPFMPLRGILGSDLVAFRPDWRVVDNPYGNADPILLLPALRPDIALFHAALADRRGNVWIGRRRELVTMAHAAATSFVTVEEITEDDLLERDATAAGSLSSLYVGAIAEARNGAWPLGLAERYAPDHEHLAAYAEAAKSDVAFHGYLCRHVL